MTARLAVLPPAPRKALAIAVAGLSVILPVLLVVTSLAGLAEPWTARSELKREVAALSAGLAEPAPAVAGAGVSPDGEAAEAALEQRIARLTALSDTHGARFLGRDGGGQIRTRGVEEHRARVIFDGSAAAMAALLAEAGEDPRLAVSDAVFHAPAPGRVRAELTLVEVVANAGAAP